MAIPLKVTRTTGNTTGLAEFSTTDTVPLSMGGTGAILSDPNANKILYWNDTAGAVKWLGVSGLTISADTLTAAPQTISIQNKTGAYTVVDTDLNTVINCTSGTFTVSLTAAATLGAGFHCWIWNTSTTDVTTIDPNGAETIDGSSTILLRRGEGLQIVCDGTNWATGDKKAMRGYAENYSTVSRPVASADISTAIGNSSTASGANSVAIGNWASTASGTGSIAMHGTAGAGHSVAIGNNSSNQGAQTATGAGAMALGGSYASGTNSFAAAVANNTSTYGAKNTSAVAIGNLANAASIFSTAIGNAAWAAGSSAIAIGNNATVTSAGAVAIGGYSIANSDSKIALNNNSVFSSNGDSQKGIFILRRSTTDATATVLTTDKTAATSTNQVVLANDTLYSFYGQLSCRNTANDNDCCIWSFEGAIARGANAAATRLVGTPLVRLLGSDNNAYDFTLTADTTNGALAITVTGAAATALRWVATVETTEVQG